MRETSIPGMHLCNHARVCNENKGELERKRNLIEIFCGESIDFERL